MAAQCASLMEQEFGAQVLLYFGFSESIQGPDYTYRIKPLHRPTWINNLALFKRLLTPPNFLLVIVTVSF